MSTSTSIGIRKWAGDQAIETVWTSGDGDRRCIGWVRWDGARAIETNGDPSFEGCDGFEEAWTDGLRSM